MWELEAAPDGSDCAHGCNGDCVVSGSEKCRFWCHPAPAPEDEESS